MRGERAPPPNTRGPRPPRRAPRTKRPPAPRPGQPPPAGAASRAPPAPTRSAAAPSGPSPGSLPQTEAMPSTHTASFTTRMAALWSGVVGNAVSGALPAFFPREAYVQLKAEASPEADWRDRLVHDYALDLTAAHELLGSGAAEA